MNYDFDTVISRKGFNSRKHDGVEHRFGTKDVIPMWIADMDFRTATPIISALEQRVEHGIFGYIQRPDSYYKSIQNWQKRRNNWDTDTKLMSSSPGVVSALTILVEMLSNPNDNILIQTPVYPQFSGVIERCNRTLVKNKLIFKDNRFVIDFVDFENKLKDGIKVFILCNPHNPVGSAWTKDELQKMGDLCIKYNTYIISDEIHSDFVLWGKKHIPTASVSKDIGNNTITCTSSTKTFNLAGIQTSTTIFPNIDLKNNFDIYLKKYDIEQSNAFSVIANEVAFNEGEEWLTQCKEYIESNMNFTKNFLDDNLPKIKSFIPEATYFMWLDFSDFNLSDADLEKLLLIDAKVALNECKPYDEDIHSFFRINLACSQLIVREALENIKKTFQKY